MMRYGARLAAAVTAAAVTCGMLPGCGAASGSAAGSITLYNGQHEQTTDALVTAFERKTGIKVNIRNDSEDTLANLVALQGSHSPADVIYAENSPALEFLQGKGLLSPVAAATLARAPARLSSPRKDWVGVSARVSVLMYNPSLIKAGQLPASVLQLASPRYGGKLALAPAETDFQPIVTSVLHSYGRTAALHWLDGLKANAAGHIAPNNETVADEVNRGIVAFGVIDQYYWYRMRAQLGASRMHAKITYFAPHDPGYVLDVSGAAVLRSSQHQAAAQEFLAYLVSAQGQRIIGRSAGSGQSFEYPVASGVRTSAPETPLSLLQPGSMTVAELGDGRAALALLRQAGLL